MDDNCTWCSFFQWWRASAPTGCSLRASGQLGESDGGFFDFVVVDGVEGLGSFPPEMIMHKTELVSADISNIHFF